jgi:predicted DCC family thiol-disulfide oxidoreductase YuxK
MKRLYVLYDAKCELCRRIRVWLERQSAFVSLAFVPLQSADLEERFPGVNALEPERQILVVADNGDVWRGSDAWIVCLWALRDFREWSQRLASPILRPFARHVCDMVSRNRLTFSRWFTSTNSSEVARQFMQSAGELDEAHRCGNSCLAGHPRIPPPLPRNHRANASSGN